MTIVRRCAPSHRFFFSALLAVAGFAEERPAAEKPRRQMLLESIKSFRKKARSTRCCNALGLQHDFVLKSLSDLGNCAAAIAIRSPIGYGKAARTLSDEEKLQ